MTSNEHAYFQVAVKMLLFDGEKILVLTTPDGYIDFPGGRVNKSEMDTPWVDALKREVAEEIGSSVRFSIGNTLFVSKRSYSHEGQHHHIAAIFFAGEYQGGDIKLSDEHGSFSWMTPDELLSSSFKFISADEKSQLQAYLSGS